jgi:plastocyanin
MRTLLIASTLLLTVPGLAWAGPVSGIVHIDTRPGVVPAPAIVYAEPLDTAAPRRPTTAAMRQRRKTFQPHVLPVSVGSTVTFPNDDTIFHNVFSLSGPEPFDLGLYRAGASRTRTFSQPGTYRVFCNIHPQMTALVLVVNTPYVTTVGPDGRYTLDLPPGRYRLTAISDRTDPVTAEVTSAAGAVPAPDLRLDETRWVAVQHKNKHGQDYPTAAYDR